MKKIVIIALVIILIISLTFVSIYEINSYSAKKENQAAGNTVFDSSSSFTVEYFEGTDVMPYCLISPSNADKYESIPLFIYLHGDGEFGDPSSGMVDNKNGIPKIMQDWPLEGFNAYIMLPHQTDKWYNGTKSWHNTTSMGHVKNLIDKFIENYNVDINNIVLSGGSKGGQGSLYVGANMEGNYFSKLAVVSGFGTTSLCNSWKNKNLPTRGYVGASDADGAKSFMTGSFSSYFGKENVYVLKGYNHDTVLHGTFKTDENANNRSDIIEWAFGDVSLKYALKGINLDKTNLDLVIGETSTLSILPLPIEAELLGKPTTWKSTNTSVATVDANGIVRAVGSGTTTIKVTVSGFEASCTVNVIQSISLDKTEIKIPANQTAKLNAISEQPLDNKTITWHSQDETIATVDENGLVTGVSEGTTTVIVTMENQTAECTITIEGQLGDLDNDKLITSFDAYKALENSVDYSLGIELEEQTILKADANKDGILESEDAYSILKYSIGLINKF